MINIRNTLLSRPPWEGIYKHFRDVPSKGKGFESDIWLNEILKPTKYILSLYEKNGFIPVKEGDEATLLSVLASIIQREKRSIKILDFGGALGIAYLKLISRLPDPKAVEYIIIETQRVCQLGIELFKEHGMIKFSSLLPEKINSLDIIYMSSVLQYIEDYPWLLGRFCSYQPSYFLFVKTASDNIPTYATAQKNMKGSSLPYWFINIQELIKIMQDNGYSLILKEALKWRYNQNNFPQKYRLKHAHNLLFARV